MLKRAALFLIKVYQVSLRRVLPQSCRFIPSCSEYTKLAIVKYGFLKGSAKGVRRISSCQPFSGKYGYDPLD
jgi:putative membrane protein insertion efficiency factor